MRKKAEIRGEIHQLLEVAETAKVSPALQSAIKDVLHRASFVLKASSRHRDIQRVEDWLDNCRCDLMAKIETADNPAK